MDPIFRQETAPNGVRVLRCAALAVPHGFSTRLGGVSAAPFDALNLGLSAGDDPEAVKANRARFAAALGLNAPVTGAHQVHGPAVRVAEDTLGEADCKADAVVCAEPWSAVGVFTADCTPILLWEPVTGAVGAVHAGWRGTVADVTGEAVRAMAERYGAEPSAESFYSWRRDGGRTGRMQAAIASAGSAS
jgi:copper oxidase (laccase) domain-containing protein